jgi:hypothetical protein
MAVVTDVFHSYIHVQQFWAGWQFEVEETSRKTTVIASLLFVDLTDIHYAKGKDLIKKLRIMNIYIQTGKGGPLVRSNTGTQYI